MAAKELGFSCSEHALSRSPHGVCTLLMFCDLYRFSSDNHGTGFPYCYGVFEAYFNTHPPFQGQNLVSTGGVLSNGVLQLSLPPVMYYVNNFPKHRLPVMWLGCLICTFSAIGAGFATTVCKKSNHAEYICELTSAAAITTHHDYRAALRNRSGYAVWPFHPSYGGMVQGKEESGIRCHVCLLPLNWFRSPSADFP